jgi:hypothetical protein
VYLPIELVHDDRAEGLLTVLSTDSLDLCRRVSEVYRCSCTSHTFSISCGMSWARRSFRVGAFVDDQRVAKAARPADGRVD